MAGRSCTNKGIPARQNRSFLLRGQWRRLDPREVFCFDELEEDIVVDPHGPPCWSPDGKTILWKVLARLPGSEDNGNSELLFAATDGTNTRRIPLSQFERQRWGWIDCR